MTHPSEKVSRQGRQFIGRSLIPEQSIYRVPKKGRQVKGARPLELDMQGESKPESQSDTFVAGVAYYELPLTTRNLSLSWKGGMLPKKQSLARVLDNEGNPIRQVTEVSTFGLYSGIVGVEDPRWLDIKRAIQPKKRRSL